MAQDLKGSDGEFATCFQELEHVPSQGDGCDSFHDCSSRLRVAFGLLALSGWRPLCLRRRKSRGAQNAENLWLPRLWETPMVIWSRERVIGPWLGLLDDEALPCSQAAPTYRCLTSRGDVACTASVVLRQEADLSSGWGVASQLAQAASRGIELFLGGLLSLDRQNKQQTKGGATRKGQIHCPAPHLVPILDIGMSSLGRHVAVQSTQLQRGHPIKALWSCRVEVKSGVGWFCDEAPRWVAGHVILRRMENSIHLRIQTR